MESIIKRVKKVNPDHLFLFEQWDLKQKYSDLKLEKKSSDLILMLRLELNCPYTWIQPLHLSVSWLNTPEGVMSSEIIKK